MRDIRFTGFSSERAAIFIRVSHVAEPALVARQQRVEFGKADSPRQAMVPRMSGRGKY